MSEEAAPSTGSSTKGSGTGVPGAIVVAGALIALAIFFSNRAPMLPAGQPGDVAGDQAAVITPEPPTIGDVRPVDDTDHVRGPAEAKLTIIEYSDLECPFCSRFHPTMEQLVEEYPTDVRWVYRHFPLRIHPGAGPKAQAAECAGEQGRFWEFTDALFEAGANEPLSGLPAIATAAGVADIPAWQTCLDEERYAEKVAADEQDAQAAGGRGTPYSLIISADGEQLPINGAQPYEAVKAAVDSLL